MTTKTPKEPKKKKLKLDPRPCHQAPIADWIVWANKAIENPDITPKQRDSINSILFSGKRLKTALDAKWSSRTWIIEWIDKLENLPHVTTLQIRDIRAPLFIGAAKRKIDYVATLRLKGKRLEHIDFRHFTMPCK